jgi:hypothetical protein
MLKALQTYSAVSAAVVAAMTIIGFVVHFRLGHLFGIELPVVWQGYLEYGGDCLLSVPVALYDSGRSILNTVREVTIGEGALLFVTFVAIVVSIVYAPCARRWPGGTNALRRSTLAALMAACAAFVLQAVALLRFEHVLQPWVTQDAPMIHEIQMHVATDDINREAARVVVAEIFRKQASSMTKTYGETWKRYFLPKIGVDTETARRRAYGVRMIALALLFTAVVLCRWKNVVSSNVAAVAVAAVLLFALPITYGTIGRNFVFPVVSLEINQPPHSTHAMYLLSRNMEELVVYDRAAGFKIRRVPARMVDRVDTIGVASPFSTCGTQGGFVPCETLWAPDNKLHDF